MEDIVENDDLQLARRATAGEDGAFEALVARHQRDVNSYLFRMTASRPDAEDLAQEVWLRVLTRLPEFQGRSSFRTWLFSITTNIAIDHHRAKMRWPVSAQDGAKASSVADPQIRLDLLQVMERTQGEKYEIREHIDFCFTCIMKTLPLEQHIALMLCDIYGFTNREAAGLLDRTEASVKHLLHEARKTMATVFEHRCALINKNGVCYQCASLNGFFNKKEADRDELASIEFCRAADGSRAKDLLKLRVDLVRGIDPMNARGTTLHEELMRLVARAAEGKP